MIFPQYRKYANGKNFFKIYSPSEFEEVFFIGKKGYRKNFKAEAYPEKLFISDLLEAKAENIVVIQEDEFLQLG